MSNREELDRLIEAALADNKLTTKEMEVLIKKAKQLGLDEDEFIIELDAKRYKSKLGKRKKLFSNFLFFFRKLGLKKGIILIIIFIIIISLIVGTLKPNYERRLNESIENKDYNKAYVSLAKIKASYTGPQYSNPFHLQLLTSYVPYLLENNYPEKAYASLLEYNIESDQDEVRIEKYNDLLISITSHYLYNANYVEASKVLSHYILESKKDNYSNFERVTKKDLSKSYQQDEIDLYNEAVIPYNAKLIKAVNDALSTNKNGNQAVSFLNTNLIPPLIEYKMYSYIYDSQDPKTRKITGKLSYYTEDKNYIKKLINEINLN